jgi:uncharacterized membrane protein YuzA (DUF378 family)
MHKMNFIDWLAMILVIIGGLNWGLVGLFNYNLVTAIFSEGTVANVIYDLVGLAALYMIYMAYKMAGCCKNMSNQ